MARERVDVLVAARGLAGSRSEAASLIRAGKVKLAGSGEVVSKPGRTIDDSVGLEVEGGREYVSRGGVKLANALDRLAIDPAGLRCLDVGASTGGFTDCLLQRGAEAVVAVDVGYGQLDWRLRNDQRVTVMERFNARNLKADDLPWAPDLAVIDVSFISLRLIVPAVSDVLAGDGRMLAMVKPQFELDRARVGKGGVVREAALRREAIRSVAECATGEGLAVAGLAPSGLPGPKGNRETFIYCGRNVDPVADLEDAILEAEPDS